MKASVYIRPLTLEDAKTSYLWRNDPEIWKYTGSKPDQFISQAMETNWLENKLNKPNEKRFAICVAANDQYIGNIQLLDITDTEATFHIFIGEKSFWGKGISLAATQLLLTFAFLEMKLENVSLEVNPMNIAALALYNRTGFLAIGKNQLNGFLKMRLSRNEFEISMN